MRTHHWVCYIPLRPGYSTLFWPWLAEVIHLYCCFTAPPLLPRLTIQVQRSLHCLLKPWAVRCRGSRLFLHEPETSTVGASLTTTPLHLSSILCVFHPAGGPQPNPILCLGLGWCFLAYTQTSSWIYFIWDGSRGWIGTCCFFFSPSLLCVCGGGFGLCVWRT